MGEYRKKPVVIEAFKFYVDPMPDWFMDKVTSNEVVLCNCDYSRFEKDQAFCSIKTLEGTMIGNGGDYIIKGVNGEIYPCKPDIFEKTYDELAKTKSTQMTVTVRATELPLFQKVLELLEDAISRLPQDEQDRMLQQLQEMQAE